MNSSTWKPWLPFACLFLLVAVPSAAQPTELFISEYIEGSSNNKAVEIYNGTGAAINLAAGGYSIQMFFNGSASAGLTINLTGAVAAGDVYVVAHASANAAILAQADQTNGSGWFNGDDAVVLPAIPSGGRPVFRFGGDGRAYCSDHAPDGERRPVVASGIVCRRVGRDDCRL